MIKRIISILVLVVIFTGCKEEKKSSEEHLHNQQANEEEVTTEKKVLSPHTSAMAMIGDAHIHIDYSSPGVRNRIVFGGLLAYDLVWQAGAHKATWLETNKDLTIDGKVLPAGKYGFFTIPSKDKWTLIFNSNWDQHGKDEYNENDDVFRFEVKPIASEEVKEHLEYKIDKVNENEGTMTLSWEKIIVSFNFTVSN